MKLTGYIAVTAAVAAVANAAPMVSERRHGDTMHPSRPRPTVPSTPSIETHGAKTGEQDIPTQTWNSPNDLVEDQDPTFHTELADVANMEVAKNTAFAPPIEVVKTVTITTPRPTTVYSAIESQTVVSEVGYTMTISPFIRQPRSAISASVYPVATNWPIEIREVEQEGRKLPPWVHHHHTKVHTLSTVPELAPGAIQTPEATNGPLKIREVEEEGRKLPPWIVYPPYTKVPTLSTVPELAPGAIQTPEATNGPLKIREVEEEGRKLPPWVLQHPHAKVHTLSTVPELTHRAIQTPATESQKLPEHHFKIPHFQYLTDFPKPAQHTPGSVAALVQPRREDNEEHEAGDCSGYRNQQ